jgi:uncharacterized protein (TIRG00374 family)
MYRRWPAAAGLLFATFLLWIFFRRIHVRDVGDTLAAIDPSYALAALLMFALAIALRSLRWRVLLGSISSVPYKRVALVLIIGYAMDILLPARLGEVFRAGFARSQFGIAGAAALGTIVVERTMDGLVFVLLLSTGLFSLPAEAEYHHLILTVLQFGSAIFLAVTGTLYFLSRARIPWVADVWRFGADKIDEFRCGLATIRSRAMIGASVLTLMICLADIGAIWFILASLDVVLTPLEIALVMGIVSLSMLMPMAPGYLGTLQFAYVVGLTSFGFSTVQGLAAATACQALLLTPLTLCGVLLMLANHIRLRGLAASNYLA